MKHALMVMGLVGIGAAAGLGIGPHARAETGDKPYLDGLCAHSAFVSGPPNGLPGVGLRAQNDYCASSGFTHPADYGSGNDLPEPDAP